MLGIVPSNPSDNAELCVEVSLVTVLSLIAELVGCVVVGTVLLGDGTAFHNSVDGEVDTAASIPGLKVVPEPVVVGVRLSTPLGVVVTSSGGTCVCTCVLSQGNVSFEAMPASSSTQERDGSTTSDTGTIFVASVAVLRGVLSSIFFSFDELEIDSTTEELFQNCRFT